MTVVVATSSVLLALVFLLAGTLKVFLREGVTRNLRRLGVGPALTRAIGTLEIAAALGLGAGIVYPPVGIAAGAGLVLLTIGAVGYHMRAGDYARLQHLGSAAAPVVLGLGSAAITVLLVASL